MDTTQPPPPPAPAAPSPGAPEAAPAPPQNSDAIVSEARPGSGMRVGIFVGLIAVLLIGAFVVGVRSRSRAEAVLAEAPRQEAAEAPAVDVVPVVRADPVASIILPGEARPFYETTLYARTSGYLKSWLVDIGDSVAEGQLLATIDTPELDDQIKESEAKLAELRSEVTLAQAAADFAKTSFDRWNTPDGVVSQQERDQKKSELDSNLARLEASKSKVHLGEAELAALRTLEGFKRVTAPFKGIITDRRVDIGDLVTAGSASSTTPMFTIVQYDQVRVFVDVPQAVSNQISVGMHVKAFAPEHAERQFSGVVDRTTGVMDPKARTLRVEVLVPNPDHTLMPGTYLQVALQFARSKPPLRIPAAAVMMRSAGPEAAVVGPDGAVSFRKLDIQQDLGDTVEVNSGLAEGDMVALNIGQDVSNGDHVTPRTPQSPAGQGASGKRVAATEPPPRPWPQRLQ